MAFLRQAKTEDEIKKLTVGAVKKAYNELASDYNKIIDCGFLYCHACNNFLSRETFYSSATYASGYFPICKKCLLAMVEQRKKKNDPPNETKESVKYVLQLMDLPYIDDLYESACKTVADEVNEKNRKSAFLQYLVPIKSLPQYKGLTWKDSEFGIGVISDEEEVRLNQKTIKNAKKRFGGGYSNEDYMFLESEYQDWITRYECNTKAQETIFERLSFKKWEINKATKNGQSTKDLDKTYQELLATAAIAPRQNSENALTSSLTFGQLIEKWEDSKPIPKLEPEFEDVDNFAKMIRIWFKGHLCRALGLDNGYSQEYDEYIKQYTVTKPQYQEEGTSEDIYGKLFGKEGE